MTIFTLEPFWPEKTVEVDNLGYFKHGIVHANRKGLEIFLSIVDGLDLHLILLFFL